MCVWVGGWGGGGGGGKGTLLDWHLSSISLICLSRINLVFLQTAWILIKRNAEWKPLQFLAFAYVYRIFEKLKAFEPPVSPTFTVSYTGTTVLYFFIFQVQWNFKFYFGTI